MGYANAALATLLFADAQRGLAAFVDDKFETETVTDIVCGVAVVRCISGARMGRPHGCENGITTATDAGERSQV